MFYSILDQPCEKTEQQEGKAVTYTEQSTENLKRNILLWKQT